MRIRVLVFMMAVLAAGSVQAADERPANAGNIDVRSSLVGGRVYMDDVYSGDADVFIEGKTNILNEPDVGNVSRMTDLFRTFEEKATMVKLLDKCLEPQGVKIAIGSESEIREIEPCSLVTLKVAVLVACVWMNRGQPRFGVVLVMRLPQENVRQGRSSSYTSTTLSLGAALARLDVVQVFEGEGGESTLNGLFMADGSRHTDTHTLIDHAVPRCSSRQLYKGIVDDRARGVFHGKVRVRQDAQKTDAWQVNKNLLLSGSALVHSTPALEIYADDVKCKHGLTPGQLDPLHLFYLCSRGISEEQSRNILTYAFASDVVSRLKIEALRHQCPISILTNSS